MLPFLKKPRRNDGIATEYRKPDEKEQENQLDGLELAAGDAIKAIEQGDKKALAAAFRAAFQILDSEPHVEGEHIEE